MVSALPKSEKDKDQVTRRSEEIGSAAIRFKKKTISSAKKESSKDDGKIQFFTETDVNAQKKAAMMNKSVDLRIS